ncbi:unnamed protein product [Choristocarpus tenellus]
MCVRTRVFLIFISRSAIERWLLEHNTSPVTGEPLETKVLFKNWSLLSTHSTSP